MTEQNGLERSSATEELRDAYDSGFRNGVKAVFQQLECIEGFDELQDFIAEYWAEEAGEDE